MLGNGPRQAIGLGTWILKCKNMNWIYRTLSDAHSLLTASFGERETASRTCAPRTPASPVLRILDPRLALAIFAAKSQQRNIDRR